MFGAGLAVAVVFILIIVVVVVVLVVFYVTNKFGFREKVQQLNTGIYMFNKNVYSTESILNHFQTELILEHASLLNVVHDFRLSMNFEKMFYFLHVSFITIKHGEKLILTSLWSLHLEIKMLISFTISILYGKLNHIRPLRSI